MANGIMNYLNSVLPFAQIALSSSSVNALEALILGIDIVVLGNLGKGNLAAGAIGNAYFRFMWCIIEGIATSQDTLNCISKNNDSSTKVIVANNARLIAYLSMMMMIILCLLGTAYCLISPLILSRVIGINMHIASKAYQHVLMLTMSLWCMGLSQIAQKYLFSLERSNVIIKSLFIGAIVKAVGKRSLYHEIYSFIIILLFYLAAYLLMFMTGLKFIGSSLSTLLCRFTILSLLLHYIISSSDFSK